MDGHGYERTRTLAAGEHRNGCVCSVCVPVRGFAVVGGAVDELDAWLCK